MISVSPSTETDLAADSARRAAIDRSVKGTVLFLFLNGAFWLMASTILGIAAAVQNFAPDFIRCAWFGYGRLQPAHMNALIYGWGIQAGLGAALWIMARRTGQELKNGHSIMIAAGVFWNIAVTIGILGILWGGSTSIEFLEMPKALWPVLLLCFLVFAWPMVSMFARARHPEGFMVSAWYLLAAVIWFPWVYITANVCLHCLPGLGAMGAGVSAWYANSLILLFFAPVGIGAAYYFVPKVTGQPIASYQLAKLGFWLLAILGGWTGMQRFMGGPLPEWMPAMSALAAIAMLVPLGVVTLNLHLTTLGRHKNVQTSPSLRFIFFGAMFAPIGGLIYALLSNFGTGITLQFTQAWYGYQITVVYGFFSMCLFGAIYYITPRLAGCEWLSVRLIRNHFWFSVYGIAAIVVTSVVGGLQQGGDVNDPTQWNLTFQSVVVNMRPYVVARAVAWSLITWSNVWFLIHLMLMAAGLGRRSTSPTLLPDYDHEDPLQNFTHPTNA
jgi:cytochrome c oxidase cbb3-type subunit 1